MIQPGSLREDIIIQVRTTIKDGYGSEQDIYTDSLYLKANIKYGGGSRGINNEEVFNSQDILFTTYYRTITTDMRILWNDNIYIINYINIVGFRECLEIKTTLLNE